MVTQLNTLKDLVDSIDIAVSGVSGLPVVLHCFQGWYNPLGYYQRLRELDVPIATAKALCIIYEEKVYKPLMSYLK